MATSEIKPALSTAEIEPERRFPIRAFLLGLGLVLLVGVIAVLSTANASAQLVSPTGGNVLVLAPAAFLAGIVSFLSPCTLPILPAYFAFTFQARREQVVLMTVALLPGPGDDDDGAGRQRNRL